MIYFVSPSLPQVKGQEEQEEINRPRPLISNLGFLPSAYNTNTLLEHYVIDLKLCTNKNIVSRSFGEHSSNYY